MRNWNRKKEIVLLGVFPESCQQRMCIICHITGHSFSSTRSERRRLWSAGEHVRHAYASTYTSHRYTNTALRRVTFESFTLPALTAPNLQLRPSLVR
ncbi:hypothetical protein DOTSEDRAFT_68892 [Dothistroma septosporum NZE10]|uniref:Uncharacterized protein n=1 Tax=Dothistroma septosporum (strain NZE10 / CBS 128990) TaxID=675120 RepID=N1Q4E5_DOTSN|nr:hypothetical protein DOTSEDRAFT_68892 [Dothistroma septosporum NZE10]